MGDSTRTISWAFGYLKLRLVWPKPLGWIQFKVYSGESIVYCMRCKYSVSLNIVYWMSVYLLLNTVKIQWPNCKSLKVTVKYCKWKAGSVAQMRCASAESWSVREIDSASYQHHVFMSGLAGGFVHITDNVVSAGKGKNPNPRSRLYNILHTLLFLVLVHHLLHTHFS